MEGVRPGRRGLTEHVVQRPGAVVDRDGLRAIPGRVAVGIQQGHADALGRHAAASVTTGQYGIADCTGEGQEPGIFQGGMRLGGEQGPVLDGGAHRGLGAVHVEGVGAGRRLAVADGVGGAGLELVDACALQRVEARTPGRVRRCVQAGRRCLPGERTFARPLDAQFHQRHAGGGVLGNDARDLVLVGAVVILAFDVGGQAGGGVCGVNGDVLALALLDPAGLVAEDVANLVFRKRALVDGGFVYAAYPAGIGPLADCQSLSTHRWRCGGGVSHLVAIEVQAAM